MSRLLADIATAQALLDIAGLYAGIGLAIGAAFVLFGVRRALAVEGRVTGGARVLLLPGAVALWPLVVQRWLAALRVP